MCIKSYQKWKILHNYNSFYFSFSLATICLRITLREHSIHTWRMVYIEEYGDKEHILVIRLKSPTMWNILSALPDFSFHLFSEVMDQVADVLSMLLVG